MIESIWSHVDMQNFDSDFKKYSDILIQMSYLKVMSETFIFKNYKGIPLNNSEKPFGQDIC